MYRTERAPVSTMTASRSGRVCFLDFVENWQPGHTGWGLRSCCNLQVDHLRKLILITIRGQDVDRLD